MSESDDSLPAKSRSSSLLLGLMIVLLAGWYATELLHVRKTQIGAIAEVKEVSSGLVFKTRVDTGAAVSSIHCVEVKIEDEAAEARENRGKAVRLLVENGTGQQASIDTKIVDYSKIKSVDATKGRYYVRLPLSCAGITKETLVTLNDRSRMNHKLLLGRDFLEGDFVVDVSE